MACIFMKKHKKMIDESCAEINRLDKVFLLRILAHTVFIVFILKIKYFDVEALMEKFWGEN